MAGPPLAGKTTLARTLVETLPTACVHVENDTLRSRVAEAMDRSEPAFDGDENHATYEAARGIVERGLSEGLHVVHDATNLDESTRRPVYETAESLEAPVRVVFVQVPAEVRKHRARQAGSKAKQAHAALGRRQPDPTACSRPYLVLDGTKPPGGLADTVLRAEAFSTLGRATTG